MASTNVASTSHAGRHVPGGLDPVTPAMIGAAPTTGATFTGNVIFKNGSPWVDPVADGADPTGATDSAPAFRTAAARCVTLGAPLVPSPGTYLFTTLDSASQCFVPLTAGIPIRALLPGTVTIKIAATVTTWTAVFGVAVNSTLDLTGLDIQNLTFEGQSGSNPYPASGAPYRYAINAYKGGHLNVSRCRFQNWDGRNLVMFDGRTNGITDVRVAGNDGFNIGTATVWHDHSSIYTDAAGQDVSSNNLRATTLQGATAPSNAVCPLELHGSGIACHDNVTWNYQSAGNLCSSIPAGPTGFDGYSWTNNKNFNVGRGLSIWAFNPMSGGLVEGNYFDLNIDQWPTAATGGFPGTAHFGFNKTSTDGLTGLPSTGNVMQRWKFRNNTVKWRWTSGAPGSGDVMYRWVGAAAAVNLPASPDTDLEFGGNTVVNCPSTYLYLYGFNGLARCTFDDKVYNLGVARLDAYKFQAAYYIRNGTSLTSCHLGGQFVDDLSSGGTTYLTRLVATEVGGGEATPTFTDVDMLDVRVVSAVPPVVVNLQAGQFVDLRARVGVFTAPGAGSVFTAGSEMVETTTGVVWRQTAAATGNTWTQVGVGGLPPVDVQKFTATGTWTKPTSATPKAVHVRVWAGGGQGGSGAREPSGTLSTGGGGGGPGGYTDRWFTAGDLAATVAVTVGVGGATGGVAVSTDGTVGAAGQAGGSSIFGAASSTYFCGANGGAAGAGGTAAGAAAGGAAGTGGSATGAAGGGSSATGGAGTAGGTGSTAAPTGGGGGGGVTTGAVAAGGAAGGALSGAVGGGTAGGVGVAGGAGSAFPAAGGGPGVGGGGGGGATAAAGGAGGAGGAYGAGGGGGGASLNGNLSGAGGPGAAGLVIVETYF